MTYGHAHAIAHGPWCWCGAVATVRLDDDSLVCGRHARTPEGLPN